MTVAVHASDRGAAKYLDVRGVHDPMGQIARHAFAKVIAPDEEEHLARILRKINGCLTRGVSTAHQRDVRTPAHLLFVRRGCVINTGAFKSTAILHIETAIFRAGGDEQTFGNNVFSAFQFKNRIYRVECQLRYRRWNGNTRAKLIGLENSAISQLASGDSGWKAQIIFNAHTAAGLSSRRRVLQHDRA